VDVLVTLDDHDYGINDGGFEYIKKDESQQLFLDFMNVKKNDKRRVQNGVYYPKDYKFNEKSIKITMLFEWKQKVRIILFVNSMFKITIRLPHLYLKNNIFAPILKFITQKNGNKQNIYNA
jgi:hypothetical protein